MKKLGMLVFTLLLAACGNGTTDSPSISGFKASAAAVNSGAAVTLSWAVSHATRVVLQPGNVDVTSRTTYPVTPTTSTTYTLTASSSVANVQASTAVRVYDWSKVSAALDGFVSSADTPPSGTVGGYSFLLFDGSGTLYTRAGGDHSLATVEMLASASKLPSSAAILSLVDQGKLNLDTPIATYLHNAGDPITWPSDKAAITMRMLLAHTSGLPGLGDSQPSCLNQPAAGTLQQCAQDVANATLVSQPGAEINYGGADYQVAGYLATLISGAANWQSFFSTAIATPLGGVATYSYGDPTLVSNPRIAGGAVSNVSDYATILHGAGRRQVQRQAGAVGERDRRAENQ